VRGVVKASPVLLDRWRDLPTETIAEVRLHGRRVGTLSYEQGGATFIYEDDLVSADHQTLGQIFEDDPYAVRHTTVGVPPWFANLLPEGELRKQVIREMGGGYVGDFTMLLRLGSKLPGAVTIVGGSEPQDDVVTEDDAPEDPDHPLRHSLAGVQLKYSIHGDRLTFPASGEGAWWIAKLPDRSLKDLSLNEYLTMQWLRSSGMDVPTVQLVPASLVGGIPEGLVDPKELIYLIKRFDRSPNGRIHVEDFAQLADVAPAFKYSQSGATYDSLARAMKNLLGEAGYESYIERLVAMLIMGNIDAHLKNWGLIYSDGRTPSLAPIYDFHSLTVYSHYLYGNLALSLGGQSMSALVDLENFRTLAENSDTAQERVIDIVRRTVYRLRESWASGLQSEAESLFPALAHHFTSRLESLPICDA
jgi:serine/threonine-protein kinase HipA